MKKLIKDTGSWGAAAVIVKFINDRIDCNRLSPLLLPERYDFMCPSGKLYARNVYNCYLRGSWNGARWHGIAYFLQYYYTKMVTTEVEKLACRDSAFD